MKKLSILLGAALLMGMSFTSCSSDDDSSSISDAALVGKWNFSKMKASINGQAFPEQNYDGNEPGCNADYLRFLDNGTFKNGDYYDTDCTLDEYTSNWTRDGKVLTADHGGGDVEDFTIVQLTGSKLKLKTTYSEGGMTYVETITFVKAAE